jgi:hypothetical protein
VEAAWIGAIVEGEGCISLIKRPRRLRHWGGYDAKIIVTNTDPEVISALLRLTGIGSVLLKNRNSSHVLHPTKPCYNWTVSRYEDVIALGRQILPFLAGKQDHLASVLQELAAL